MAAPTALQRALLHPRRITVAGLLLLCGLAWLYLLAGAGLDMSAWDMTQLALAPRSHANAAMQGMAMPWDARHWLLMVAMWWTMMIAMMTPSAAPAILLHARVKQQGLAKGGDRRTLASTGLFATGYFLMWLAFALAATALQLALEHSGVLSELTMDSQWRGLSGTVLVVAGLYQLSPWKNACLTHCRNPAAFFARHWRPHALGTLRMGALHGTYCIGCCWMLMVLLFVGGVMNLVWIAALSLLVLAEKVLASGRGTARGAGLVLIAWGAYLLA